MDSSETPTPLARPLGPATPQPQAAAPRRPPAARPARPARVSWRTLVVLGAVLVAACLVWFFFVRDTGNPFAGTWRAPDGALITGTVAIAGPGRHIEATFSGNAGAAGAQTFTVRAHKDGEDLVITAEDFADAAGDVADAQRVRNTFAAFVKDFRLVFRQRDPTHLELTVEGTFIGVIKIGLGQRSVLLTKVD